MTLSCEGNRDHQPPGIKQRISCLSHQCSGHWPMTHRQWPSLSTSSICTHRWYCHTLAELTNLMFSVQAWTASSGGKPCKVVSVPVFIFLFWQCTVVHRNPLKRLNKWTHRWNTQNLFQLLAFVAYLYFFFVGYTLLTIYLCYSYNKVQGIRQ